MLERFEKDSRKTLLKKSILDTSISQQVTFISRGHGAGESVRSLNPRFSTPPHLPSMKSTSTNLKRHNDGTKGSAVLFSARRMLSILDDEDC